ncbi:MAG: DUF2391 family protein [Chloroflexi bacterium]|nr:DUF2391 family protein [Chloroflexota bacterium]
MLGGLLIGLPLLFTQETWNAGFLLSGWKILVLLGITSAVVVGYNSLSGFRRERNTTELLIDSIEAIGLAIVVALVALFVLGRINVSTDPRQVAGTVALEAIAISIGISVASTQFAGDGSQGSDDDRGSPSGAPVGSFGRLLVAAGGALLFALNVAPTEEPLLLGVEADWWLLLLAMAASFLINLSIVFYAEFRGGRARPPADGPISGPLTETLATYAVSLLVSLLLLWAFGRTDGVSLRAIIGPMIMLGVVASFGAAAGRLLIVSGNDERDESDEGGGGAAGAEDGRGTGRKKRGRGKRTSPAPGTAGAGA